MENEIFLSGTVVAEIELSYKPVTKISSLPVVRSAADAYHLFLTSWDKTKIEFVEQFKVMILNRACRVLGICTLSTGSATSTIADPKMIFAVALKANASRIILAHNHPTGNTNPSKCDQLLTEKIIGGGRLLEIDVEDHLIITSEGYYSFAEKGAL